MNNKQKAKTLEYINGRPAIIEDAINNMSIAQAKSAIMDIIHQCIDYSKRDIALNCINIYENLEKSRITELEAENKRLKEALTKILTYRQTQGTYSELLESAVQLAEQALKIGD